MPDKVRNREWLEAEELVSGAPGLPRPDLNPLMNPLLGKNMGRWAQVYFTSPPDQREHAVEKLLHELQAESGTGIAAGSTQQKANEVLHNSLKREPEIEAPALPIRDSVTDAPDLDGEVLQDVTVCPGCRHKNPAEQRFCGICGMALTREVASAAPAATQREQASRPDENPESDWRWLRERTLSTYDVQSDTGKRSRVLIVALVLVVIGLGAYILWQNRARLSHEQAVPAASSVSESGSSPSMDVPVASAPSPEPAQQAAKAKSRSHLPPTKSAQAAEPSTGNSASADLSSASTSEDGRDELIRARHYLAGEGVPKNSWMASQMLWKAIGKQNSEAVLLLSDLYARGDGVPRSCEQARILLVSAAKKGSSAAAQKLRSIETSCR